MLAATPSIDDTALKTFEQLCFDNSYARLPDIFHSSHAVSPLKDNTLAHFNVAAADLINLDPEQAQRPDLIALLGGDKALKDLQPIACCYAGHQFGQFVPRLGDGRAILLGEVKNDDGSRWDLQLKGAGLTLYSRQGDGRAVLRSSIREYLCSEAMHGLGIGTTRALYLTSSTEPVYREQVEPGAMVLRMAPSHARFGTFEYFYYNQQVDELRILADDVIDTHFPQLREHENPYLGLLQDVIDSTAQLIAQWQSVGFMHGVMNTDNMSIHGITIDYGPYGFMEAFDAKHICNHSDYSGRYAFNRQPEIALFNLSCLAQAMVPLFDDEPQKSAELATAELHTYQNRFNTYYRDLMRQKLGFTEEQEGDIDLQKTLFNAMQTNQVDFTRFFRALSHIDQTTREEDIRVLFKDSRDAEQWLDTYHQRLLEDNRDAAARSEQMKRINPKYILRNHMAETAIRMAEDDDDFSEIDRLMTLLSKPCDEQPDNQHYADHTPEWAQNLAVSCSS